MWKNGTICSMDEIKRKHLREIIFFFYKKWFDGGIKQIKCIMYELIPGFVPVQVIRDKIVENYDESKTVLENQYKKLKEIIPFYSCLCKDVLITPRA